MLVFVFGKIEITKKDIHVGLKKLLNDFVLFYLKTEQNTHIEKRTTLTSIRFLQREKTNKTNLVSSFTANHMACENEVLLRGVSSSPTQDQATRSPASRIVDRTDQFSVTTSSWTIHRHTPGIEDMAPSMA